MIKTTFIALVSLSLLALGTPVHAGAQVVEIVPFQVQNQSPLVQIYGLPTLGDSVVLGAGRGHLSLGVDLANNYIREEADRESLLLDGESTRFTLRGRYGLGQGFEVGIEVPYIVVSGGFLDSPIESYHKTFGFPNGGREEAPSNRLLHRYTRNGRVLLNVFESANGMGDVSVTGGWQLCRLGGRNNQGLVLRAGVKLPTGDSDFLLGSGGTDVSLWLTGSRSWETGAGRMGVYGAAGGLLMSKGKILADQQSSFVGFGALGLGWRPWSWLALKVQANGHTAFYRDSHIKALGEPSVQLTLGGAVALSSRATLDLALTEDVVVGASPDCVFHLLLSYRFW